MMKFIKQYFDVRKQVHEYFGYKEDWVNIPLEDMTDMYWFIDGDDVYGELCYFEKQMTRQIIENGEYYTAGIYAQRFLSNWIYRTDDFTMISMDTQVDGNKFLGIFDNKKEGNQLLALIKNAKGDK